MAKPFDVIIFLVGHEICLVSLKLPVYAVGKHCRLVADDE